MMDVSITHLRAAFTLDVAFTAAPGVTALFGQSGAGKTTIVNVIAGLVKPDRAVVKSDGVTLTDTHAGIALPTHQRRLGYVFQEARLFPHLTVVGNLNYGRWFQRPRADQDEFDRVTHMLDLQPLLMRRPETLSGGEKQRVAIGRALLASPRLLLMDEPLSSLDEGRKQEILPYLERLRDKSGIPIIYVSHSVAEVARLADTIVLLSDGRVAAYGPAAAVMQRVDLFALTSKSESSALIEAEVVAHDARWALTTLRSRAGQWQVPRLEALIGTRVRMRVQARDVMLALSEPRDVSASNVLSGSIAEISSGDGGIVDIRVDCGGEALLARITAASADRLGLRAGTAVYALIKTVAIERQSLGL